MIKRPPGPKGLPLVGSLFDFLKDRLGFLKMVSENYGDFAFFKIGPRQIYFINNPEFIKDILITNNKKFIKSKVLQRSKIIVGEGLLTSEKDNHIKNRRAIQPLFHTKAIPSYANIMVDETKRFVEKWIPDTTFDFHNEMMKITQTIVVKTLFGTDLGDKTQELIKSLNFIMKMFPKLIMPFSEIFDYLPLPSMIRLKKEMRSIDETIYELIAQRKKVEDERYDLLNILLNTKDENGNDFFTKKQIRDEIITFFIAGQETTSNSLCWTWYLLSQNPEYEDLLYREVDKVLNGRLPTVEDLNKLKLIENTFKEALRMYPPAWVVSRRATENYEINGYTIPKGADIYMSQYV
ncbi:MAG: cytochrome P450, partial [Thermodesulfobacteriota bacterium]